MSKEKARLLVEKFNSGIIKEEEEVLLEQYMEEGLIELEELKELQTFSEQVDLFFSQHLSQQMKSEFQQALETEKERALHHPLKRLEEFLRDLFVSAPKLALAYSIMLLLGGLALGRWILSPAPASDTSSEIAVLSSELKEMREMMMLSMLEKKSTSERLKAVHLTSQMEDVSETVADALLQTLNQDQNVNVRLSSLEALFNYAENPRVREGLIRAIAKQESPLVQLALAEVMVALQEKRSVEAFEELIKTGQERMPPEVKEKIEKSIQVLL